MNDEYFLIKGTPEEWIKNNVSVDIEGKAYAIQSTKDFSGVIIVKPFPLDKLSLTDPSLTKPTIRVPVWGQEFKVQGVKMEKGVICVDVTPPLIKDQYGNVLAATAWVNDTITVKTPPKTGSIMPESTVSETQAAILTKENERLKKELADMTDKMSEFRENYRKEHERANKLQDSEAAAKRKLTTAQASQESVIATNTTLSREKRELEKKYNDAWNALTRIRDAANNVEEIIHGLTIS